MRSYIHKRYINKLALYIAGVAIFLSTSLCWGAVPPVTSEQRDLQQILQKRDPLNKTITVTPGDWVVSSDLVIDKDITLKLQRGAHISIAPGSILMVKGLLQAPIQKVFTDAGEVVFDSDFKQRVYPQWWGAKGDGVRDDTSAVQIAINAFSTKGGVIIIPEGTYIIDAVAVKSNITVKGTGSKSILKQKSGAKFCVSTNPTSGKSGLIGRSATNISFRDLTFRGTVDTDGFSEYLMLLDIRGTSNVAIMRCNFSGFRGDGIYIGEAKVAETELHNSNIKVSECLFDGINKDNRNGISVIDCDGLLVEKCTFRNCSRKDMPGAIDVEPNVKSNIVRNINIAENRFENVGGINIIQISITFKLEKLDSPVHNIVISKNIIEGDGKANGIYVGQVQLADDRTIPNVIIISDNVVRNTKRSFMIFGVKDLMITGNIFEGCEEDPYLSYSRKNINIMGVKIVANTFKDLAKKDGTGISIFGANNLEFKGNTFDNIGKTDGTKGNALFFRRHGGPADHVTIENNTFKGSNTTVAIQRELGNDTVPEHNRIRNNVYVATNKVELPANDR